MSNTPIAIVGAAARLPGAPSLKDYWSLLLEGRDAVSEVPAERWSKPWFEHPDPARPGGSYTFSAGVLDDIDAFDAAFFGISRREAEQMDPQQRWLLELAAEAMQDAALPSARLSSGDTGVYVGASGTEYANLGFGDPAAGNAYFMTGTATSITANRISYVFDLKGPSFTVDTACSSSLVALHLACEDLRRGRTSAAIAGGVNILLTPYPFVGFSRAAMLSPDGRCFAFDARANGYVRAEGAAVVVLKRLDDALADGDPIRAVIRASGVNSDGRTMGLSLPNGKAQAALLKAVYDDAGLDPQTLGFVEAHGTGTAVGDPIELGALGEILGARRSRPLPIGSAKTNVGHLEVASGMAGLLKAVLSLEHGVVPPSLHFETPNPDIDFKGLNLSVVTKARVLDPGELRAGVNSFGFGGSNAHVVLEGAPVSPARSAAVGTSAPLPLLMSARSPEALSELADRWTARLEAAGPGETAPLLRAAARRKDHYPHRRAYWPATPEALLAQLRGDDEPGVRAEGKAVSGRLAFVFSGNGAQWLGMGRDVLEKSPVFRCAFDAVDTEMQSALGWSLRARLLDDNAPEALENTDVAQPLLFAIQVGVVESLRAMGVVADAVVGHSVGEIAAAWAAGALSLSTACRVVIARSRHQQRTQGLGRMAALALGIEEAEAAIADIEGLEISAENSAAAVTVAGPGEALATLRARATEHGWRFTELALDYAFHTAALDSVRADLFSDLQDIDAGVATTLFVSTVTGEPADGSALGPDYWWRNIRDRVRFRAAIDHLIEDGTRIFLEIGPHPILQSYVREQLRGADVEGRVVRTLSRRATSDDPFNQIAAELYVAGYDLPSAPMFDGPAEVRALPQHPWRRESYWFRPTSAGAYGHHRVQDHALLGFRPDETATVWTNHFDGRATPWILDHRVESTVVLPAAVIIEMALAAARAAYPQSRMLEVRDLGILNAVVIDPDKGRETRFILGDDQRFRLESRLYLSADGWAVNATGRIAEAGTVGIGAAAPFSIARTVAAASVYESASRLGLEYGPTFRPVADVEVSEDGAARVIFGSPAHPSIGPILAPEAVDGALQGFLALQELGADPLADGESLLPERFGRVRVFAPGSRPSEARLIVERQGVRSVQGRIGLFDTDGAAVAELQDCVFRRVHLKLGVDPDTNVYGFVTVPAPLGDSAREIDLDAAIAAIRQPEASQAAAETSLLLDAYVLAVTQQAIEAVAGENPFTIEELVRSGRVDPSSRSLLASSLHELDTRKLASVDEDGLWRLDRENAFADPLPIWRTVFDEAPDAVAELALAAALSERLPQTFQKGQSSPTGDMESLADHWLTGSEAGRTGVGALCDALRSIAERWPENRPLRVLQVEAGSGAATERLLRALAAAGDRLSFVAADQDQDAVSRLQFRLEPHACTSAVQFSTTEHDQSLFDVIVSVHAMTRLGAGGPAAILQALGPGGAFITVEPRPSILWDSLMGARPDWWLKSVAADYPLSPLRDDRGWASVLTAQGFEGVRTRPLASRPWSATLVMARRSLAMDDAGDPAILPELVVLGPPTEPLSRALANRLGARSAPMNAGAIGNLTLANHTAVVILPPAKGKLERRSADVIEVIQAVAAQDASPVVRLVTRGAAAGRPDAAALQALARTLINELPGLDLRLLDFAPELDDAAVVARLAQEIAAPDLETDIVHTAQGRRARRLSRGLPRTAEDQDGPQTLVIPRPGLLSALDWRSGPSRAPAAGEVAIDVRASGLNFRDLMWAQGLLPEDALQDGFAGPTLGLECVGVVSAVGAGVEHLAPGDRVMAMAPQALSARAVTAANAVVKLRGEVDFEAAATLPVAFLTVIYALGHVAHLADGERVLIHGGAGAVGMAAIQFAKSRGAVVFATAGTSLRRALVKQLGADHVLDSRSLSFAEDIRRLTNGEGVDVVLNSLSGEAMIESLELLRPFGRFLELGKRDFFNDTQVGLRPLRKNVAYFAIDADSLPVEKPELAAALLQDVVARIEDGSLRALPYRVFERSDVVDAFRLMQAAGHLGKLVITPDATPPMSAPLKRRFAVPAEGVVIVTGGLTGFGLETARWLAGEGALRLALIGRRGEETPGAPEAMADLAEAGAEARAFACDVSDRAALDATLKQIRAEFGPIRAVYHAAAVIEDGLLASVDAAGFGRVFGAKLDGAVNLDQSTQDDAVEQFILFSSATTLLGAPGQGAYVAANTGLEALSARRNAEGRPSLAVGWGPIADAGLLAREDAKREALARRLAATPMSAAEALAALPRLFESGASALAYVALRLGAARGRLPILKSPTFAALVPAAEAETGGDLTERLAEVDAEEARTIVQTVLKEEVARILASAPDRIELRRPLPDLGMDSLMAVELRMALETRFKVDLPLLSLSENTTVASLSTRIVEMLRGEDSGVAETVQRHEVEPAPSLVGVARDAPPTPVHLASS